MSDTEISFNIHAPLHGADGEWKLRPKSPQHGNAGDASTLPLASAAATHVDRIKQNVALTKPHYTAATSGPQNKAPLPYIDRSVLARVRDDATELNNLHDAVERMEDSKEASAVWLKLLPEWWIFSGLRNYFARDIIKIDAAIEKTEDMMVAVLNTYDQFEEMADKIDCLHRERMKSIPADAQERADFFDNLRAQERDIIASENKLETLKNEAATLITHVANNGLSRTGVSENLIRLDLELMKDNFKMSFRLLSQKRPLTNVGERMDEAIARTTELEHHLEAFEKEHGPDALHDYLADGKLTASVALQALRSGESLSPELKNAITDPSRCQVTQILGRGTFNTTFKATVQDENGVWSDYALKPLDSRITTPKGMKEYGHHQQQVGVFGRQHTGAVISDALKLGVVGKPRYVLANDRLCMAAPLVKGESFGRTEDTIRKNRGYGYWGIAEALHQNPSFQDACQKLQLFHAVANNWDGHGSNMKLRFFVEKDGREFEFKPADLGLMTPEQISKLRVEAGAFDLDLALSAQADIEVPVRADANRNIVDKNARRVQNYLGPPQWHTAQQYDDLRQFQADLQGRLGAELEDHLIGGDERHPDQKDLNEMSALKLRVDKMVAVFEKQLAEGKRLNDAGNVVDSDGNVIEDGDHRERLSNEAGYAEYRREKGKCVKTSLAHMLMPVKESIISLNKLIDPPAGGRT